MVYLVLTYYISTWQKTRKRLIKGKTEKEREKKRKKRKRKKKKEGKKERSKQAPGSSID